MSDLLALAETELASPTAHSNRIACWLARSAMEEIIDDLLAAKDLQLGEWASARSKLTCIEVAYQGTGVPTMVQYAWSRLSDACHQHAYELSPTYSETRHLVELVRSVPDPSIVVARAGPDLSI